MPGNSNQRSTGGQTSWTNQPGVQQVLGTAGNLFNSGTAWAPYTNPTVSPFSTQQNQGLAGLQSSAVASQPAFNQNFNRINSALQGLGTNGLNPLQDQQVNRLEGLYGQGNNTGLNPLQMAAYRNMTPTATGLNGLQMADYNAMRPTANGLNTEQQIAYNRLNPVAAGTGYNAEQQRAIDLLNPVARGSQLTGNPYLQKIIDKNANDIRYQTGLSASAAGRYGSGGREGVLQNSLSNMETNLRYGDYANQQARQDAAIRDIFGMGQQGLAQKVGAINGMANLGTTGANQRMNALTDRANLATTGYGQRNNALTQQANLAGTGEQQRRDALSSLYNAGQQGFNNTTNGTQQLSNAYDARLSPYQTMLGVGGAYQQQNQNLMNDQQRIFGETQNSLTGPVDWLNGLARGYQGGQSGNNNTVPNNRWQNAIQGGLNAYGGSGNNPWLGLLGGIGGALF